MSPSTMAPRQERAMRVMQRSWFPVARSVDLDMPRAAKLLGTELAVFRSGDGVAMVVDRRCPHRGGDLSGGRVIDRSLACPYHGWRYSGESGECVLVPSLQDQARIPPGCAVRSYRAVERYGHVWTVLGEPLCQMYEPAEWTELDLEWLVGEPIDSPTGVGVAIENFADVAHFPFVHTVSMGPMPTAVEPLNVRRDGIHVYMERPLSASTGEWSSQGDCMMMYHIIAPGLVSLMYDYEQLGKRFVIGFPSPMAYDEVRIFWGVANEATFGGDSLETCLKIETDVYLEDVPIVGNLSPREIPWDNDVKEWSAPADRFTLGYRRAFVELMNALDERGSGDETQPAVPRGPRHRGARKEPELTGAARRGLLATAPR